MSLAGGGLLLLGQLADLSVGQAQRGLLAGVRQAHGLEFIEVGGGLESHHRLLDGGGDRRFIERARHELLLGWGCHVRHVLLGPRNRLRVSARARATTPV